MKFALVNDQRHEAQPNLSGKCIGCGSPMTAKCGERRTWHWAHKGRHACDPWLENETDWHRAWKDQFPMEWQKVRHPVDDGSCHIADVRTDRGWVIEFQHSHINPEERRSREAFYLRMLWVVDATRLKRDQTQLASAYDNGISLVPVPLLRKLCAGDCRALDEWAGGSSPVFFDLGRASPLLYLLPRTASGSAYVHPVARDQLINWHCSPESKAAAEFEAFVTELPQLVAAFESRRRTPAAMMPVLRARRRHRRL